MLIALERLDAMTSSFTPDITLEALEAWLTEFRAAGVNVQLVESAEVAEARKEVKAVMNDLTEALAPELDFGHPVEEAIYRPYVELRPRLNAACKALSDAMRADLAFTSK